MDSFIVELMRRRIVEQLLYYAELTKTGDRKYLVSCENYDKVKELKHRGCLLWCGQDKLDSASVSSHISPTAPPRLSTIGIKGVRLSQRLAVHNLAMLLGEDHLDRLREGSLTFREGSLFLLCRRRTVDVQMKLWKLQGYLGE